MGSIGPVLRSLREDASMTQEELAERTGLSVRTVSDIERGLRRRLYADTAARLADALALDGAAREEFLEHARGRLTTTPGLDVGFRRRFVQWHLGRIEELAGAVGSEEHWYAVLDADEANLTVALRWAEQDGDTGSLLRLATGLWQYWQARGALASGRAWLERGLSAEPPAARELRERALWGLAWLAYQQGDYPAADGAAGQLLQLADQPAARRNAETVTGMVALARERTGDALAHLGEALALARGLGQPWLLATSLLNLGIARIAESSPQQARALLAEALRVYEGIGDERFRARCLGYLGLAALVEDDLERTAALFSQSLAVFDGLGEPSGTAEALTGLSAVAAAADQAGMAARLGGAAERIRESFAGQALPVERRITDTLLDRARASTGSAAWAEAWTTGRALRTEDAVLLAQGVRTFNAPGTTSTVSGSEPMRSPSA